MEPHMLLLDILEVLEIFYTLYSLQCIKLYFISGDQENPNLTKLW